MNKSLFIKEEIKKVVKIPQKGKKSLLKFNIYNYTDKSKQMIFDMFEKKIKNDIGTFDLSEEELRLVFNVFTDYLFTIEELSEIIESPNIYFEEIFFEINMIICDIVKLYIQEQKIKIEQLKIEDELIDLQNVFVEKMQEIKDINGDV